MDLSKPEPKPGSYVCDHAGCEWPGSESLADAMLHTAFYRHVTSQVIPPGGLPI